MRVLIISEPNPVPPPPEAMPGLLEAMKGWRDRWRSKMEMFEFFAGGEGGWGVLNVADEVELSQVAMEYPFAPFSRLRTHLTINGDDAMARLMAAMGG